MTVGGQLREARQREGLTLEQVAASTNIRASLLARLEDDDWAACGGAVYARGHLRAIAGVVGLDPVPLLARFDSEQPAGAAPELREAYDTSTGDPRIRDRNGPHWLGVGIAAGVVVVGLLGYALVTGGRTTTTGTTAGNVGSAGVAAGPHASATAGPSGSTGPAAPAPVVPARTASPSASPKAPVDVKLTVTAASWVSVTGPGATFEGTLAAGSSKEFTSSSAIQVVFGNAGGVDVTANGHHLGVAGSAGQVKNVIYQPAT